MSTSPIRSSPQSVCYSASLGTKATLSDLPDTVIQRIGRFLTGGADLKDKSICFIVSAKDKHLAQVFDVSITDVPKNRQYYESLLLQTYVIKLLFDDTLIYLHRFFQSNSPLCSTDFDLLSMKVTEDQHKQEEWLKRIDRLSVTKEGLWALELKKLAARKSTHLNNLALKSSEYLSTKGVEIATLAEEIESNRTSIEDGFSIHFGRDITIETLMWLYMLLTIEQKVIDSHLPRWSDLVKKLKEFEDPGKIALLDPLRKLGMIYAKDPFNKARIDKIHRLASCPVSMEGSAHLEAASSLATSVEQIEAEFKAFQISCKTIHTPLEELATSLLAIQIAKNLNASAQIDHVAEKASSCESSFKELFHEFYTRIKTAAILQGIFPENPLFIRYLSHCLHMLSIQAANESDLVPRELTILFLQEVIRDLYKNRIPTPHSLLEFIIDLCGHQITDPSSSISQLLADGIATHCNPVIEELCGKFGIITSPPLSFEDMENIFFSLIPHVESKEQCLSFSQTRTEMASSDTGHAEIAVQLHTKLHILTQRQKEIESRMQFLRGTKDFNGAINHAYSRMLSSRQTLLNMKDLEAKEALLHLKESRDATEEYTALNTELQRYAIFAPDSNTDIIGGEWLINQENIRLLETALAKL